jgi:hypothetical protein
MGLHAQWKSSHCLIVGLWHQMEEPAVLHVHRDHYLIKTCDHAFIRASILVTELFSRLNSGSQKGHCMDL